MGATKVPTIFLSAATDDLEALRNVLHGAFSRAGFRVFTQKHSLSAAAGTLRDFLVDHIRQSDCIIHLAGMAYGSDADEPFPDAPAYECSWTQFEYYFAHHQGKKVTGLRGMGGIGKTALALVLAHDWAPQYTECGGYEWHRIGSTRVS